MKVCINKNEGEEYKYIISFRYGGTNHEKQGIVFYCHYNRIINILFCFLRSTTARQG